MSNTLHPIEKTQTGSGKVSLRYLDFEGTRSVLREHLCGESDMPLAKSAAITRYTIKSSDKLYCVEEPAFTAEKYERDVDIINTAGYYGLVPLGSCGSYHSLSEPFDPVLPPIFEMLEGVMVLTMGHSAFFQLMLRNDGDMAGENVMLIRHVLFRPVVEVTVPQLCPNTTHEFREMQWVRSNRGEKRRIVFV